MNQKFEKYVLDIFKIDPKIRYVAVFDNSAKVIAGGMREGIKSLMPESITKLSADEAIIRWKSRLALKDWIGLPKYAFAEYEKIKRYTIYLDSHLILISTELDLDSTTLINKVYEIFENRIP